MKYAKFILMAVIEVLVDIYIKSKGNGNGGDTS